MSAPLTVARALGKTPLPRPFRIRRHRYPYPEGPRWCVLRLHGKGQFGYYRHVHGDDGQHVRFPSWELALEDVQQRLAGRAT